MKTAKRVVAIVVVLFSLKFFLQLPYSRGAGATDGHTSAHIYDRGHFDHARCPSNAVTTGRVLYTELAGNQNRP